MSALLPQLVGLTPRKAKGDGFGQSLLDDIRFAHRFRRMKRVAVAWRAATLDEEAAILDDPMLGRFADDVVALAEHEGRAAVLLERLSHGYPDPPRYVLFVVDEGKVWAAADFDRWPARWPLPVSEEQRLLEGPG